MNKKQKALVQALRDQGVSEEVIKGVIAETIPQGISGRSDVPTTVSITEFKGKPTLSMIKGTASFINKPFTFGKAKAQMIVEQYDAIKAFAETK